MKNNKIITSWNKIEPSDSAQKRMLSAILEQNRSVQDRKDPVETMTTEKRSRRRWIPLTACLVALIAVLGIVGSQVGWFGPKDYTKEETKDQPTELASDIHIDYQKGSVSMSDFAFNFPVSSRELTDAELDVLFPDSSEKRSAFGTFRDEDGALVRLEGKIGSAEIIMAAEGMPGTDVIFVGNEKESMVHGTPVKAGYFITDPNSKGEQTAVFFGEFVMGTTQVYLNKAGDKNEMETVRQQTSALILQLIERGEPDFSAVTK